MKKILLALIILFTSALSAELKPEVAQQIIKKAEKDYPNNYSMQKRVIQHEIECYLAINEIKEKVGEYIEEVKKESNKR